MSSVGTGRELFKQDIYIMHVTMEQVLSSLIVRVTSCCLPQMLLTYEVPKYPKVKYMNLW